MPNTKSLPWRLLVGSFTWLRVLRSTLLVYIIVSIVVYFIADGMIFLPPPPGYIDGPDILKIQVNRDQAISAYYLSDSVNPYSVMFIHGNAEDIGHIRPLMEELFSFGFNVFAYDYRGYGTSDGKPSERDAYLDAEAAYRYLTDKLDVPPKNILLYGRSIGSGSAVDLASRLPVGGLILEAPFTSIFRVVVPFKLFPFDKFNNLRKMQNVTCPVLVMHGSQDRIIPLQHGQMLYEAAPEPKQSLWIESAGHNDFAMMAGGRYRDALEKFRSLVMSHSHETRIRKHLNSEVS